MPRGYTPWKFKQHYRTLKSTFKLLKKSTFLSAVFEVILILFFVSGFSVIVISLCSLCEPENMQELPLHNSPENPYNINIGYQFVMPEIIPEYQRTIRPLNSSGEAAGRLCPLTGEGTITIKSYIPETDAFIMKYELPGCGCPGRYSSSCEDCYLIMPGQTVQSWIQTSKKEGKVTSDRFEELLETSK